jgi:hypothetical protein
MKDCLRPRDQAEPQSAFSARNRRAALRIATVGILAISLCGCSRINPRHGLILRGDWSFEVNRIPWMAGHNARYQTPWSPCGPPGDPDACGLNACGGNPCSDVSCGATPCGHAGCAKAPNSPIHPTPALEESCIDYGHHPRFHPVPTKPAFSPRGPSLSGVGSSHGSSSGASDLRSPHATLAEPEVIPSPKPDSSGETTPAEPRRLAKPEAESAWIFAPPANSDADTQLARRRSQAARAALR